MNDRNTQLYFLIVCNLFYGSINNTVNQINSF